MQEGAWGLSRAPGAVSQAQLDPEQLLPARNSPTPSEGGREGEGLHKAGDRGGGCSGLQAEPVPISPVVETGKLGWELGEGTIPPTAGLSPWHSFPKTDVSQI